MFRLKPTPHKSKVVRSTAPTAGIVAQLRRVLNVLDSKPTTAVQVGDVVQIAPNSDNAYQGLPGIVQQISGYAAMVSILAPHRGGSRHRYPLALLRKVGGLQTDPNMTRWSGQIEKVEETERQERRVVELLVSLYVAYRNRSREWRRISAEEDGEILKLVEGHIDLSKLSPPLLRKPRSKPKPKVPDEEAAAAWEQDLAILKAFEAESAKLRVEALKQPQPLKKPVAKASGKPSWQRSETA